MKPSRRSWWSSASLLGLLAAGPVAAIPQPPPRVAPAALVDTLVMVTVNGVTSGEPVTLLRGAGNSFYASRAMLAAWRITTAAAPAIVRGGVEYRLLNAIPGLALEFAEAEQSLAITAAPEILGHTRLAYPDLALGDEVVGGTGAFVNYDVTAQLAAGDVSVAGLFEAGIFTRWGVGTTSFLGNLASGAARLTRLATNWTIDDPAKMRSIRLGDSVSRGGAGGAPLRFGGVQVARNFAVQPGFVTFPLPSIAGSAALPSVVDIYVNGTRSDSRDLPPGPFQIIDVPIVTGGGDIQLVVRDLLGRETLFSQSYYAAPTLLRRGLHDYSYEAGLLRRSFGVESNDYGAMMVSATHRYGITDSLTGEVHGEATRHVQVAGAAAAMVVRQLGHVEASLAASHSGRGAGAWGRLGLERRTGRLTLGASAELSSKDYQTVGSAPGRLPPASVLQAFAGLPLGFGSLGLSYLRRDGRGEPDAEFASASASVRLGGRASLQLAGRKSLAGEREFAAQASLMLAAGDRASASTGVSLSDGQASLTAAYEKYRPVGEGVGYRLAASVGRVDRLDARIGLNSRFGSHEAQLTWTDGKTGVRLSTAGGIGIIAGGAFASRPLSQSFARVKVGDYANVRVYADNQLVGRTGPNGTLVLPRLRPFDRNQVRIELADLPWDAHVAGDERSVRPYDRHGIVVDFRAGPARAAIIRVLLATGSPLPPGSTVRLDGAAVDFISAPGGEVYVTGLEARNTAVASWAGGTCRLTFDFTPSAEPQPRLGDVVCAMVLQ